MEQQQYPEPAVGALVFNPEGKVFFMTSPKYEGKYVIPGGRVECGETIAEAVIREVKEETNLDVRGLEFIGMQESIYNPEYYKKKHFIFFDYACKADSIENVKLNEEGIEYVWVTADEALQLPLPVTTRELLLRYIRKHSKK